MTVLNEYSKEVVDRFIKSMGYDPEHIDNNKRMAFTKTNRFKQFAQRFNEEVVVDEATEFPQGDFDPKGTSAKVVGEKKLSKKASVVKEIFKKHRGLKEDLYDKEKDDKEPASYGVKPKHIKAPEGQEVGDNQVQARAVLSGGKTLTGQPRDTVEFDPMMKKPKPGAPNTDMGGQKQ